MTNYRSLAGGYFSADPTNKLWPVSIRCNNPGALNTSAWLATWPGYLTAAETTPGNKTAVFETPEQGVAAWCELMRKYREAGATTVGQIINRYGGGQDYSAYVKQVSEWSGLLSTTEITLQGDETTLLRFAKAMFRYEAGAAIPWTDNQIRFGFALSRNAGTPIPAPSPVPQPAPAPVTPPVEESLPWWLKLIYAIFGKPGQQESDTGVAVHSHSAAGD
jgi:hypothetical protein